MLDFPAPRLRAYARETVIAEKFQAMVMLGRVNSRLASSAFHPRLLDFTGELSPAVPKPAGA